MTKEQFFDFINDHVDEIVKSVQAGNEVTVKFMQGGIWAEIPTFTKIESPTEAGDTPF